MNLEALGPSAAVVVVVIAFIKYMQARDKKQDDIYDKVADALEGLSKNVGKNTTATKSAEQATKSADTYLRERNGRDNEHHAATLKAIQVIPKTMQEIADNQATAIIKAVTVKEQTVSEQKVEHQTIHRTEEVKE